MLFRASKSEESSPSLVFVTQTGPGSTITDNAVKTQIRKHVMKDIGKARRTRVRPLKPISWEISVEVPDSAGSQDEVEGIVHDIAPRPPVNHVFFNAAEANSQESIPNVTISAFSPLGHQQGDPNQMQPPVRQNLQAIYRLGGGRMDPFVKYPIEMNHRARQLIDHGMFLSSNPRLQKY